MSDLLAANGDYLVGTHLTHADLAVYAQLYCIFMTPEGMCRAVRSAGLRLTDSVGWWTEHAHARLMQVLPS